ncbi:hypothetical protein [Methylomonas sp. CM2]|uniref:hypothetical protein n=1 Tax=Methylomonas sp. CM2 TaxID=3417647 RepID=UPI003CFAAD25
MPIIYGLRHFNRPNGTPKNPAIFLISLIFMALSAEMFFSWICVDSPPKGCKPRGVWKWQAFQWRKLADFRNSRDQGFWIGKAINQGKFRYQQMVWI